jgi:hypothetical protein
VTRPPPDNLGHHVHVPRPPRNRPVLALAAIVALLCAIVVWLALTRHTSSTTPEENQRKINRLACEVVALGGQPVPGTRCSPSPRPSPTRHPQRHGAATPVPVPVPGATTVIVPGGGATTVVVPRQGGSGGSGGGNGNGRGGSGGGSHSPSPQPSPTPLVCVAGHCLSPLAVPLPTTRHHHLPGRHIVSFVKGRWAKAQWRPLGPETEPNFEPRAVIAHTIVGNLAGAEAVFRPGGYDGTEAHFGIGGPWDGKDLDGVAYQWQDIYHEADAQYAGNALGTAVEHSDGGNPHNPFSTRQLETDIDLFSDLLHAMHAPAHIMHSPTGTGIGYHELFASWNTDAHVCPGPVREGQLRTIIIPKVRAVLDGTPTPHIRVRHEPTTTGKHDLRVDGVFGHDTIAALQSAVGLRGPDIDGIFGPTTRRRLQADLGTTADGSISTQDVRALQSHLWHLDAYGRGTTKTAAIDGRWGHDTTRALQRALNEGKL